MIRERVEPHLGVDLRAARVVSGPVAAMAAASLDARAFTADSTIVLGQGQSAYDSRLMAHEATHVAQQAAGGFAVHRATIMREASSGFPPPLPSLSDVVGAVVPDAVKDEVLGLIRRIPGYTLLTLITGVDPLTGAPAQVDRQALVDQLMSYGPFGAAIARTLDLLHAFEDVATLVSDSFARYGLTLGRITGDVASAWQRISVTDPSGALEIGRQTVDAILADVSRLVSDLVDRVLAMVKDAVLGVVEPLLTDDPTLGPVWRLATKVLHRDPLRGVPVDAPTVEILAGFLHLIGKDAVLEQMRERGTLQQTADWLDSQLATFLSILDEAGSLFSDAWAAIQPGNLSALPDTLPGLAQRALGLVRRVGDFATTVIGKVLELIKTSLLGLLTEHAEKIPGFRMIKVVLGRNPFTGEEFPRTAENLIGGFISLLPGGEETYAQLAESGVIADAAGRIETAMTDLGISAEMIIATFRGVWDTLSLEDLLAPVDAFERVVAKFGDPIARIVRFVSVVVQVVVELVLRLMHFPTELLAHIVSEVQQAVEDVRKDPVGFLKNMFEALKRGILGFFDRIGGYLIEGLAGWLFHGLGKLGITIPKDLSFASILKLVLDVLGLSVEFLWTKLGEKIGPEKVAKVRAALDTLAGVWQFVKDVQEKGIAAIWEYVQSQLSNLWQTLLSAAMTWVTETLVKKGLAKLATFLDPTGIMAVVNSVIAVIEAINSAIEYAKEILEIVDRYVSTIAAVARGDVEPGAAMVEKGFASAIPVALGFLAPQVGLGNLPEEIAKIVGKLRAVVAQAVEWVIDQAWKLGKAAIEAVTGGGAKAGTQATGVKGVALQRLEQRITSTMDHDAIQRVVASVLVELMPQGLQALHLSPVRPDGSFTVLAKASPETNLLTLIPKVPESSKRTVHSLVRLTLAPDVKKQATKTVPVRQLPEPRDVTARVAAEAGTAAVTAGTADTGRWLETQAAMTTTKKIEEVPADMGVDAERGKFTSDARRVDDQGKQAPEGTGTQIGSRNYFLVKAEEQRPGGQTHTGAVFVRGSGETHQDAIFWNRGAGHPGNSASHAETAFLNWWKNLSSDVRSTVRHVQVQNDPYSPCYVCAGNMAAFGAALGSLGISRSISWSMAYERSEEGGSRAGGWSTKSSLDDVRKAWDGPYGPDPSVNVGYERRPMGS